MKLFSLMFEKMGEGKAGWLTWDLFRDTIKLVGLLALLSYKSADIVDTLMKGQYQLRAVQVETNARVDDIDKRVRANADQLARIEKIEQAAIALDSRLSKIEGYMGLGKRLPYNPPNELRTP